mmetsp:Transcript_3726/g.6352  ORF Transcript_3726/g.6352 Transcript_3726/m.6352 type:complete len:103 (+) Transcript_3726:665-973(+)
MDRIKESKINTSVAQMCEGLPQALHNYFNYVRGLKFEERPDYPYLRKLFRDFLHERGDEVDVYFDWLLRKLGKETNKEDFADAIDDTSEVLKSANSIKRGRS